MTRGRIIFLLVALFIVFIITDVYVETDYPVLTAVNLESEKLPEGTSFKILQISDLHDENFGEGNSRLLELTRKAAPDIIAITGDLADRDTTDFTNILRLASVLKAETSDIYYVSGNHEQSGRLMKNLLEGLSAQGVEVLMNSGSVYKKGNMHANICGINFPFRETSYESGPKAEKKALSKALDGIDTTAYSVLLSHSPRIVGSIEDGQFDLVLSGHTHGGQIRFPFLGSLMRLDADFFSRYDKGLFRLKSGLELYVDSGLGTSILPVRFCDRASLTLLTISGR